MQVCSHSESMFPTTHPDFPLEMACGGSKTTGRDSRDVLALTLPPAPILSSPPTAGGSFVLSTVERGLEIVTDCGQGPK